MVDGPSIKNKTASRGRICFVATIPFAINAFLRAHVESLRNDYDITLVTNGSAEELGKLIGGEVGFVRVRIKRNISIKSDLVAIFRLMWLFWTEGFDCVHSITPKAGLLCMVAARAAGVPLRFHTFTGQVWATDRGIRRHLLRFFDKCLACSASHLLADSRSQRQFLIENDVVAAGKTGVLAEGSFAGVDIKRFRRCNQTRQEIRATYGIHECAIVFLFVGRLNRAKGLTHLIRGFAAAATLDFKIHLLVVGPDEEGFEADLDQLSRQFPRRVHRAGFTDKPESFMSASDVFCLHSYREGFGSVLIEAASVGLPVIASRIYGITDAVIDGVTGILHRVASDAEVAEAMLRLAADAKLRDAMGCAGQRRAAERFSEERVTTAFAGFYREMFVAPVIL